MSGRDAELASSTSSNSRSGSRYVPDEETPLLHRTSTPSSIGNESECTGAVFEAAALIDGSGLEAAKLAKVSSYTSSEAVVDDSDAEDGNHSGQTAGKESPYLCGVSRRRFWVLYSVVLLQLFVRD